jgi:hypothetical protein
MKVNGEFYAPAALPQGKIPNILGIRRLAGPRVSLDAVDERKPLVPVRNQTQFLYGPTRSLVNTPTAIPT